MKELYLLLEEEELAPQQQADNKMCTGDAWTPNTVNGVPRVVGSALTVAAWRGVVAAVRVRGWEGMLPLACHPQGWSPAVVAPPVPHPGGGQHVGCRCREGRSHGVPPRWVPSSTGPQLPLLTPNSPAAQRVHQDAGRHEGDPEGAVHGAAGGAARCQ